MADPTCPVLSDLAFKAAKEIGISAHKGGTLFNMEGPQFSSRAESSIYRQLGLSIIGMTQAVEAKLAREAQICYALVALASDYDCWRPHEDGKDKQTLLKEIIANLKAATNNCLKLAEAVLSSEHELIGEDCPCRKSLDLAVWTDPAKIEPNDKEKLKVLFE